MKLRWISTEESYAKRQWTILAVIETIIASLFAIWLSARTESLIYFATWSAFGWLLLLRNPVADHRAYRMFQSFYEWWSEKFTGCEEASTNLRDYDPFDAGPERLLFSIGGIIGSIILLPALYVSSILIKVFAVMSACVTNPIQVFLSIPENWRRAALCLDIARPLELLPGLLDHLKKSHGAFKLYKPDDIRDPGDEPFELLDMRPRYWATASAIHSFIAVWYGLVAVGLPVLLFATPAASHIWIWLKPILVWYAKQFGWPEFVNSLVSYSWGWHTLLDILWLLLLFVGGLILASVVSYGGAWYLSRVQKMVSFVLRGPGRVLIYLPALLYRFALKATTIAYYPLLLYRNRYVGERSIMATLEDIRSHEKTRCRIAYFLGVLFLLKLLFFSQVNALLASATVGPVLALLIVPASIPWWHIAVAINCVITITLFHTAGRLQKNRPSASVQQPRSFTKWILNATSVVAGILIFYALFCDALIIWKHRAQITQFVANVKHIKIGPFLP